MDCHKNTSCFFAMTKEENGNFFIDSRPTAPREWQKLCNINAVTANPLGCGSLWKIKNNNENGRGLPRKYSVFSRNDGKRQRQWMKNIPMCCHCEPVRVWQSMENKKNNNENGKGNDKDKRQTAKAKTKRRIICFFRLFITICSYFFCSFSNFLFALTSHSLVFFKAVLQLEKS